MELKCARLNWQLACQFFSANNISYRIVSYRNDFVILSRITTCRNRNQRKQHCVRRSVKI